MEKTRKRIRILLLVVFMSAVVIGAIYYFESMGNTEKMTEGTLICGMKEWEENGSNGIWK